MFGRAPLEEGSAHLHDNTEHSQGTYFHAARGIRTRNPIKRSASDPRLRPRSSNISHKIRIFRVLRNLKREDTEVFTSVGNGTLQTLWFGQSINSSVGYNYFYYKMNYLCKNSLLDSAHRGIVKQAGTKIIQLRLVLASYVETCSYFFK
jgi:hypothetical protein